MNSTQYYGTNKNLQTLNVIVRFDVVYNGIWCGQWILPMNQEQSDDDDF